MKKYFVFLSAIVVVFAVSCSQSGTDKPAEIPSKVQQSFSDQFKSTNVEWEVEDGYYEAEFE
ncbi:MAG: hypothetical protein K8R53_02820 [Bacteroidales bacterium]|nr:hypothetical protein [Bacteroidales bacterium]